MTNYDVATPYTACYVLLRREDQVAFVLRSGTGWMDGNYGLPSGKVEHDEPMIDTAVREAEEEVGVKIEPTDLKHALTMHRKSSGDGTFWVDLYFEVQKWQGEPFNAEPHKHGELAWLDIEALPGNIVPSVKFALDKIASHQPFAQFGWDESTANLE